MRKKEKNTIRVAVGRDDLLQSSIWRFWINGNEIYVAAREAAQFIKLSLHSSGKWRLAHVSTKDINDPLSTDKDPRVIARWQRPKEFQPGWTQCLNVLVPAVSIKHYFSIKSVGDPKGDLELLDGLSRGYKVQLTVLLAESDFRKIEEVTNQTDHICGFLNLINGKKVWIIARKTKMSQVEQDYSENIVKDMRIDYKTDPGDVFAAMMIIDQDQPYPLLINIALGWNNVFVANKPGMPV